MNRLVAIIVALLVLSASLGYAYHEKSAKVDDARAGLMAVSNTALFCLSDLGALETMLENNASEELVRERVGRYAFCSLMLSEASSSLYEVTGEEIYWNVHVAASNLADFFNHAKNSKDPRKPVAENLSILLQIDREVSGMYREWTRGNVTESMASQLLNLTEGLSW
ncbi:conserved exported protein of unknown function [Thermococcus nautili]|uniref:hypothetical protein n=1 Tax=Thermococcus nautili TaxID=195522 RepID=UPI002553A77F|nr:hypothetical protein [Thermococcus nautili]CAI1493219.1 conserved exported protein of unknown function [Thermococcus nautili]